LVITAPSNEPAIVIADMKPTRFVLRLAVYFAGIPILCLTPVDAVIAKGPSDAGVASYEGFYGNYRDSALHVIGIDRFVIDSGEQVILISDYTSGVVRRLFPTSVSGFVMGPGFEARSPAELKLRFVRGSRNNVIGVALRPTHGAENFAKRVPLIEQQVSFQSDSAKLAGTLMMPATRGPHPAIILLHGSGPLTRNSFGPYPHFFTSLGLAVLIYDKRGTGASTGTRVDVTTLGPATPAPLPTEFYPDGLANDAMAAFRYLQSRQDIDAKKIGFWGSSEGGMLTTQVAARNKEVAFAIDSSGFMGPLSETTRYQIEATRRARGFTPAQVQEAAEFTDAWLNVARTGEGYEALLEKRQEVAQEHKPWMPAMAEAGSLPQMRWAWEHVLSFNPLSRLPNVTCPVLGVWGELDEFTDSAKASKNMRSVLSEAGNTDVTVKIFPNANHPLMEMPGGNRMAPGVFETLRFWLQRRVLGTASERG
jgi:pimeloyl-ACP methyl ester carboxylesterase